MVESSMMKSVSSSSFTSEVGGKIPGKINNKTCRISDISSVMVTCCLAHWFWLGSIAIYAANAVVTLANAENFLSSNQRSSVRDQYYYFKLNILVCSLTEREMGSARSICRRHATHKQTPLQISTLIYGVNRPGAQLHSDLKSTPDHDDGDDDYSIIVRVSLVLRLVLWNNVIRHGHIY